MSEPVEDVPVTVAPLPCPFCGHEVTLVERESLFVFSCPDHSPCIGSGMATYGKIDQRTEAVTAWNTRALPKAPDGDALREARQYLAATVDRKAFPGKAEHLLAGHDDLLFDAKDALAAISAALQTQPAANTDLVERVVYEVLRDFHCYNMADQYGEAGFPLVDLVSNEGPGATVASGKEQLQILASDIAYALASLSAMPSPARVGDGAEAALASLGSRIDTGDIAAGVTRVLPSGKRYIVMEWEHYSEEMARLKSKAAPTEQIAENANCPTDPVTVDVERAKVIEECARIADAFALGQKQMANEEGSDDGLVAGENTAKAIAQAIRSRALNGHVGEGR